MSGPFRTRDELERLEETLRRGAAAVRREPPARLAEHIRAAVRAVPRAAERPAPVRARWIAAAAGIAVLAGAAWWFSRPPEPSVAPRRADVVALSREILEAGTRVLALPARAGTNLELEARNLLADTARAAEEVVRGLPAPLRAPLQRM
jgi:hypothetical protein